MKICSIHDVAYPDNGTCWCCDQAKQKKIHIVDWQAREAMAKQSLLDAENAAEKARQDASQVSTEIQQQLDLAVTAAKLKYDQAVADASAHKAEPAE